MKKKLWVATLLLSASMVGCGNSASVKQEVIRQEIGDTGIIYGGTFEEEWKPTTDGYGDGATITIEPVQ